MKKTWAWLAILAAIELMGCTNHFEPFVGITSGKNRTYAAPVESYGYNYEDMDGGSIGGGCIPGTPGVEIYEVGKKRYGGGATCGAAALKAKWTPGMTMKINWKVIPYPDWRPKALNTSGMNFDHNQLNIIDKYDEYYSTEIPLPPPPSAGDDFGKVANITVHFLACNQLFITYGTIEEGRNTPMHYKLFAESQKLCTPRPVVKSMADYRRNKARMDAVKAERKNIPQVILPRYIKQLEAEGKLPVTTSK